MFRLRRVEVPRPVWTRNNKSVAEQESKCHRATKILVHLYFTVTKQRKHHEDSRCGSVKPPETRTGKTVGGGGVEESGIIIVDGTRTAPDQKEGEKKYIKIIHKILAAQSWLHHDRHTKSKAEAQSQ